MFVCYSNMIHCSFPSSEDVFRFDPVSFYYSLCCTMAIPAPKVLILGHSLVKRLHNDLVAGFDDRVAIDFKLVGTASVFLHGIGSRTVPKLWDLNLHESAVDLWPALIDQLVSRVADEVTKRLANPPPSPSNQPATRLQEANPDSLPEVPLGPTPNNSGCDQSIPTAGVI